MANTTTPPRLRVATEGTAGPYIRVPLDQLDEVKRILDDHHVFHWVEENAISLDGGPYNTVINLGRDGDAAAVQAILDKAR